MDVYTNVVLRLGDFLKEQRSKTPRSHNAPITFADARQRFEQNLQLRHDLKANGPLVLRA